MAYETCPVCELPATNKLKTAAVPSRVREWTCERCGSFREPSQVPQGVFNIPADKRFLVSAYVRNVAGVKELLTHQRVEDVLKQATEPPIAEKMHLLLQYLQKKTTCAGLAVRCQPITDYPVACARNGLEMEFLLHAMEELGWIRHAESNTVLSAPFITAKGYDKLSELALHPQKSNRAFVAMWFSDKTEPLREVIRHAMELARYDEPLFADEAQFNGYIMDKVIGGLKECDFVVADFTSVPEEDKAGSPKVLGGVRGGVYFEAGYGKGMGKEVIVTCHDDDDSKRRRHFDIDQHITIFWKQNGSELVTVDGKSLAEALNQRIRATVGVGTKAR